MQGSHRAYAPTSIDAWWLCPDCAFLYASALRDNPSCRLPLEAPSSIAAHMGALAEAAAPGAGLAGLQAQVTHCNTSSARNYLLWLLREGRWVAVSRARRSFVDALGRTRLVSPHQARLSSQNFQAAMDALLLERLIWVAGAGGRQAVRARGDEPSMPAFASARQPPRRRPRSGGAPREAPPNRSRRTAP